MAMLWQFGVAKLRQSGVLATIQYNKGIKIVDIQWWNFTTGYLLRLTALNIFMEKPSICYCDYQNHRPYIVLKRRYKTHLSWFHNSTKKTTPSDVVDMAP